MKTSKLNLSKKTVTSFTKTPTNKFFATTLTADTTSSLGIFGL